MCSSYYTSYLETLPDLKVMVERTIQDDILFIIFFVLFSLAIGIAIYRLFAGLSWVDSFYNASMILSGAGPVDLLNNDTAKILAGFYTLYSGVFFLILIAIIIDRVTNEIG